MALLVHPRIFCAPVCPKVAFAARKARFRLYAAGEAVDPGAAIVWYKHDLRVEDHPGLVAALKHRCVVPLYIFDRRILSRFSEEMMELLLFALADLRRLLREQGSNLLIKFGRAESVLCELVKEIQASSIFVEEEVEYELCRLLDVIKESLSASHFVGENPKIVTWSTPFYDFKSLTDVPSSFNDFRKLNLPVVSYLDPPTLPVNAMNFTWGSLPTLSDLKEYMGESSDDGYKDKEWISLEQFSAESLLQKKKLKIDTKSTSGNQQSSSDVTVRRKKPAKSAFITSQGNSVGGGSDLVLNALTAYLKYLEGTAQDEWQEVHEKQRLAEEREGASFQALFGSALLLGIITRRRVYFEAIKYEKERNAGFMSPFGYSTTTVAAAINTVSSMEWYWLLSLKSQRNNEGQFPIRIWRWKKYLVQYTVAGQEGPATLLVHGFGAFLEHYRDNIYPIAKAGNRVWALTLVGFGKSEKPNVIYTELMWAELLRDFIIDVVGEPVHLVGNSIGGYCVAIAAGLWSSLAKSVVLLNPSGNIIPGYSGLRYSQERQTSGAAWLGARLLLSYLRFSIKNTLRSFYPTKPDRADDQLVQEMIRASYDPGVIFVLESIFSFDLSLPLNVLLEGFEKRILLVQGMNDPLRDSKSLLSMFREHCRGATIKEINAGHCPHDELPNEVNSIIEEWVLNIESQITPVATVPVAAPSP
ncbi:uncharacterized protein LOC127256275 [Andrographis paniculata]|uniref:uncharacterized protein LOC127256275 n=1 Tax=Andrographis paniculata TaxID=175694 RepID=UPI0021E7FDCB|nr:uncharacterized protein LOC127256275 [Andrographis paniculata]